MTDAPPDPLQGRLVRPQTRLADEVAHVLRDLILRGELAPGTPLLQIQLADRLGVSRTPLREAFRILERDGLLRISNGNKTVEVIEVDRTHLIETYQVREAIDGLAARLAATAGLARQEERHIEDSIARMQAASDPTLDAAQYGEAHADFHLAILHASGNSRLEEFVPLVRLSSHMLLTRYLQQNLGSRLESTIQRAICAGNDHHREIFEAVRRGDTRAAEQTATRHIRTTLKAVQSLPEKDRGTGQQTA